MAAAPPKRLRAPAWPHSSAWRVLVEGGARPERGVTQPWGHSGDTCGAITRPPCPPPSSFPHSAVGPALIPPAAAQRPPSVLRGGGGGIDPWEQPRTPSHDNRHSVTPRCSSCGHRDPAAPGGEEEGARKRRGGEDTEQRCGKGMRDSTQCRWRQGVTRDIPTGISSGVLCLSVSLPLPPPPARCQHCEARAAGQRAGPGPRGVGAGGRGGSRRALSAGNNFLRNAASGRR